MFISAVQVGEILMDKKTMFKCNIYYCRWGPNAKETAAIKKYLDTQNVDTRAHPLVGGLEVDLPALYHAVQSFGGLSEVRRAAMSGV